MSGAKPKTVLGGKYKAALKVVKEAKLKSKTEAKTETKTESKSQTQLQRGQNTATRGQNTATRGQNDRIGDKGLPSIEEILLSKEDRDEFDSLVNTAAGKESNPFKTTLHKFTYELDPRNRVTSQFLNYFEFTAVSSIRAEQIQNHGQVFTDVTGLDDPKKMAMKEIHDRRCPLSIKRYINGNTFEVWDVNDMIHSDTYY